MMGRLRELGRELLAVGLTVAAIILLVLLIFNFAFRGQSNVVEIPADLSPSTFADYSKDPLDLNFGSLDPRIIIDSLIEQLGGGKPPETPTPTPTPTPTGDRGQRRTSTPRPTRTSAPTATTRPPAHATVTGTLELLVTPTRQPTQSKTPCFIGTVPCP